MHIGFYRVSPCTIAFLGEESGMTLRLRYTARTVRRSPALWPILLLLLPTLALAATSFTGQVVEISDGDTSSVLR